MIKPHLNFHFNTHQVDRDEADRAANQIMMALLRDGMSDQSAAKLIEDLFQAGVEAGIEDEKFNSEPPRG